MHRLFVAVELPETLRDRLKNLCGGVPGARWVSPENMHLTLCFIGDTSASDIPDIVAALDRVHATPFEITLTGVGSFGNDKRPRSIWVGLEKNTALGALQQRVEETLLRVGLSPEQRKFTPHVTLGRLKNAHTGRLGAWIAANNLFRADPFLVTRFFLYSSFLSHSGAIHHQEAEFEL